MTNPEDKCLLCVEQMLSLACPGGCFTATAHEVDGVTCKLRQLAKAKTEIDRLNKKANMAWVKLARVCGCLEPGEDGKPACDPPRRQPLQEDW